MNCLSDLVLADNHDWEARFQAQQPRSQGVQLRCVVLAQVQSKQWRRHMHV